MTGTRILRSHRVVLPDGVRPATLVIEDGVFSSITDHEANIPGDSVEDFGNLVISPGGIDVHVHVNEPGRTNWEGFETATRAAAAGGTTTIADMPLNSLPVTTSRNALRAKIKAMTGKLQADVALYGGLIPGNVAELEGLVQGGVAGIKTFLIPSGIDEFPASGEADLLPAAKALAAEGRPLLAHAELEPAVPSVSPKGLWSHMDWLESRPAEMESRAIKMLVNIAAETGAHIHIVHVASAEAVDVIRNAKTRGVPVTAETCPHYLAFCADDVPPGNTLYKCAPPLREPHHREALWQALRDGALDMVATDHSPSPPEVKALETGDFRAAWGGISSIQFLLSATWTEARKRGFTFEELAAWLSVSPASLLGLKDRKGCIATGFDADMVVWNPDEEFVVEAGFLRTRHRISPWIGRNLFGRVEETILRGESVYRFGSEVATKHGEFLSRKGQP